MRKKFLLKPLVLLCALIVGSSTVWAETKSGSWDLTSSSSDWTSYQCVTYFNQPYGMKKVDAYIMNKNISNFSTSGITSIKVGVKSLQNGGTSSVLTVYLVDANGNTVGTGKTIIPVNASSASNTTYQYVTFSSNLTGATGFQVKCTTFGKNILINGANYEVTYTPAPAYTITAQSNNTDYGTVSLNGNIITASPATGYRVSTTTPYTVSPVNSATVFQNGNEFIVTPSANTTVTINFETIPPYTVTLGDDNSTLTEASAGAGVTLPERTGNDIYTFVGWSEANILTETTDAPSTIISAGLYHPSQNITLYPLFNRTVSGVEWHLVTDLRTVEEGVYAVLTNDNKKAFNGSLSNNNGGHGQTTTGEFSFTNGVASSAPAGTCEITMIPIENKGSVVGFKMRNADKGYLYAKAASSGNLHWKDDESSYWKKPTGNTTNWIYSNNAYLRSYQNNQIRTYASTSGDDLHMAKKVSNETVYYVSTLSQTSYTVIYNSNGEETIVTQTNNPVFSLTDPNNVPTGFTFEGWTIYDGVMDVDNVLEGETIDLTDYNTDNASLYAVFSGEVGAIPAIPSTSDSFVKVTEIPANGWAGDYLIVYEDFEVLNVLDTHSDILNKNTYGTYTDLYQHYNNGVIESNATTSSYTITIAETTNGYSLYDNGDEAYLGYTGTGTGSKLRWDTQFESSRDEWTLGVNSIVSVSNSENAIRWNSTDPRFAIYGTNGQEAIQLYKYVEGTPGVPGTPGTTARFIRVFQDETAAEDVYILGPSIIPSGYSLDMGEHDILSEDADLFIIEDGAQLISSSEDVYATVLKNISQHGATTTDGGWNFIASPIAGDIDPATAGLVSDELGTTATSETATYDLYRFIQNPVLEDGVGYEWKNYRKNNFMLSNGAGYLYANKNGVTLNFVGNVVPNTADGLAVPLVYAEESAATDMTLRGWNLVGNPFTFNAYVNRSFYKMNDDGSAILAEVQASGSTIAPCTGIMVKATAETGQSVTFSKEPIVNAPSNGNVSIAVVQVNERGASTTTIDNAIVSFNEGSELPKFYFGNPNANLYIPQGEKEYAILSAEGQGEMPLNFRANADGQYTLTVNPEGVEMNYLHLIDNMTGNDVDLLATPSYTFNATTRDYESRFRLVFAANNENGVSASSTTFAFYSNGNWMVNNEGEATLQVIDVMGRVLSNQTISGTAELSLNQQPGVYVLRLVNGNDVKTQKIVVR